MVGNIEPPFSVLFYRKPLSPNRFHSQLFPVTSPQLYLSALLLAPPLLGFSQTPDAAPAATSRFYVGLAAYHSNFQNLGSWQRGDTGFRVPVQLTAGYQLRPRLALELGVAYSGRTTAYTGTISAQYSSISTTRTASGSALARYALIRQPAHRLQIEALGGFTLVHTNFSLQNFIVDYASPSQPAVRYTVRSSSSDLLLTAGLGLRYRLSFHFALNFDITTNRNLNHPETYNGYTGSAALGLRYRFGQN